MLATPHSHKWLDGVSDALTDFLRRLRETYPCATAKIRPGPTPTADYRPSRRSPWPAAIELAKPVETYANCFIKRNRPSRTLDVEGPAAEPPPGLKLRALPDEPQED